jgi:hypothetical protein
MNTYFTKKVWRMFCAAVWFALALPVLAEEKPNASNIGFMENPPKELKEKFPMCDAFLKVEWIDKESNVGYSEYEFYNQGKKINRVAHALIYLDGNHPVFDVNLDEFRKKGKLKETFDLIKRGEFEDQDPGFGLVLDAERNGTNYQYTFRDIRSDWGMPLLTLADHKMNICIPYPDNQRMYFAEQKTVGDIHEVDRKRAELKQWIANLSFWDDYIPLDLNFDGKEDYLTGTSIIYLHEGKYFEMKIIEPSDSQNSKLISPTTGKACEFRHLWAGGHYFTTEGKNVFIDNQCNLTELTK